MRASELISSRDPVANSRGVEHVRLYSLSMLNFKITLQTENENILLIYACNIKDFTRKSF